jgi:hypothetical protein
VRGLTLWVCVDPGAFTLRVDLHRAAWPDHRAKTQAHGTLLWASKGGGSRYTFNYDLIDGADPKAQLSSVWSIPSVPKREKLYGYHPTQKRGLQQRRRAGDRSFPHVLKCCGLLFDEHCGHLVETLLHACTG